ncbi:LuxR family transcriptional regulator [Acrocarpospora corrugata]|uniref:LuxR family transcriptional regulator n=1 Tax=Acrocarpospora corrugata TaxID=35763 RepID=A0A5M3W4G4_9ACTN|nr:LuxR family transcriptional regulator [Acrocarpospora corrugata]GES03150.1 LuxR family transcriptional regulator [Acrocarpospora corrugata]
MSYDTSLIGRETEVSRLTDLIDRMRGSGGALVVRGAAGIGKSALLGAAVAAANARGFQVFTASGVQSEAPLPYAGLHQLLHPLTIHDGTLPPPQRDSLRAAFGMTDATVPDLYLVALATLNLLAEVTARTPALLVVDDAHWLDQASAQVLTFLARRLGSEAAVLLAGVRDGFPSTLSDAGLPELALEGLPDADAERLLDAVAPDLAPNVRGRVLREATGNPLALMELPRSWRELQGDAMLRTSWLPLTTRLEKAFSSQAARLPAATRTLLLVAAVNDGSALAETLPAAARLSPGLGDQDLAPAVAARLITVTKAIVFRHPLMRSAVYQAASLAQRHAAHAAVADTLAELSGESPGDLADRVIWHRAASSPRPDEGVAAALDTMAARARHRGAAAMAVTALEQAARLSHDPYLRAERLLRGADVAVELGNNDVVGRLLRQTEPLELSPEQHTRVLWIRGAFDDGTGDRAVEPSALAELAESVAAGGDQERALRILWSAALRCFWVEPGQETRQRVVAVAENLPVDRFNPQLLAILAYTAPIERGAVVIDGLRQVTAQPVVDPQTARLLGTAAVLVGELDLAERLSAAALSGLRSQGRLQLLARALSARAWSAVLLVNLDVAIPAVHEATMLARETGQPLMYGTALATDAMLAALRGELDRARALATEAEKLSLTAGVRPVLATVQAARGLAALAEGHFAEAYDQFARMHDPADLSYHHALRCYTLGVLADAAAHSGADNVARARGIMAEMEAVARRTPSSALHSGLLLARAFLAGEEEAPALFEEALASDSVRWPFVRAHAQFAYGEWLRRRRHVARARPLLRAAREAFDALGVTPWNERARQELRASGERSRRRPREVRDKLTPQEFQIIQLAAEGMTNREIGQRLYLSHRTIGAHLYRIFPKLGITSRSELRHALISSGPADR